MNWNRVIRTFGLLSVGFAIWTSAALADDVVARIVHDYSKPAPDSVAALGISRMECRCSFTLTEDSDERFWSFESEPRIRGVDPEGPAHGLLEPGDVLVAIDRLLITTHEAGKRFANVHVDEPVELTVRRGGSLVDVSIVPAESGDDDEATIDGLDESLSADLAELRVALRDLSEIGLELGDFDLPDLEFQPLGWFGFGLSFSGRMHYSPGDSGPRWNFDKPPKIESVTSDSPAERAGLRPGDRITQIDGVRLDTKKGSRIFSTIVPGQSVELELRRFGASRTVVIVAEERPGTGPLE